MIKNRLLAVWVAAMYCLSAEAFSQDASWYKYFTGTIDKYPVTLHLYKSGNNYEGFYYYNSRGEPIELGNGKLNSGKLALPAYTTPGEESFEGILTNNSFIGSWKSGKKVLPFTLALTQVQPSFDYIFVTGNRKIKKKEAYDREELTYTASSIWPQKGPPDSLTYFLKKIIRREFDTKEDTAAIGNILLRKKKEFLYPAKRGDEYEVNESLRVAYQNKNLLSLSHFIYTDMGGAHGIYGTSYFCFDWPNKRQLNLGDIIDTLTIRPFIPGILEKYFRKKYALDEKQALNETLLVEQIPMTDNVLITSKGIGFNYAPYEIGPFAMGDILIFVPYKEFEGFLKPSFKKLLQ
ncbi:MAG: DUF3298 domain-containing protein [Bacteroidota bacterium]|nr:DUF3298 domain-containing protein [Bacteroidota bacterium]